MSSEPTLYLQLCAEKTAQHTYTQRDTGLNMGFIIRGSLALVSLAIQILCYVSDSCSLLFMPKVVHKILGNTLFLTVDTPKSPP